MITHSLSAMSLKGYYHMITRSLSATRNMHHIQERRTCGIDRLIHDMMSLCTLQTKVKLLFFYFFLFCYLSCEYILSL